MPVTIGTLCESAPQETRVSLVPEVAVKLTRAGARVLMERGAGERSNFPDRLYQGVDWADSPTQLLAQADVLLTVQPPTLEQIGLLRPSAVVVGYMQPYARAAEIKALRDRRITSFAIELIPRISRAQAMDALSSQAAISGYKAVLIAANSLPKFLPMLTTAAGTIRPAKVLVLGAGVAGLMAIATSKRLGAIVEAYDVRRAAGEQVRSLGAKFLELQINAEGSGGYARELTDDEKRQEQEMLAKAVADADVVITTAAIPGRRAPILVRKENVERMRPGAVIVDLAAETGGNCELTRPGETIEIGGVRIASPLNLPSQLPTHASQMYSKNLESFLGLLLDKSGAIVPAFTDEVLAASLLTEGGRVVHKPTADLLAGAK